MEKHLVVSPRIWLLAILVMSTMLLTPAARANEIEQILRGFEIAPVKLNLAGKDWALVGLGSYIVNTTGCNDCHTHPNWAPNGNPYLGQPEQINTTRYMAGGRQFCLARFRVRSRGFWEHTGFWNGRGSRATPSER